MSELRSASAASTRWSVVLIGLLIAAVLIIVALGYYGPRALAVYELYYSQSGIRALFHDDLGFSDAWASLIAVVFSFFYALAWVPLSAWTTRVLAWKFSWRQLSLAFLCWITVYGHSPLAHALLGSDVCFNQRTGKPLKWYVVRPGGEVQLFDSGGFDPLLGMEKRPVTSEICEIFSKQKTSMQSKWITGYLPSINLIGSLGETRVWYHKSSDGTIELFDGPGFEPETRELLVPVTINNQLDVKKSIELMQDEQQKEIGFWLVRDGNTSQCKPPLGEINYVERVDVGQAEPALLARGTGCYCGGITYCKDWLYGKVDGKYRFLLGSDATSGVSILETRHNGYKDIIAPYPMRGLRVAVEYQFDGNQYRKAGCLKAQYTGKRLPDGSSETGAWERYSCGG